MTLEFSDLVEKCKVREGYYFKKLRGGGVAIRQVAENAWMKKFDDLRGSDPHGIEFRVVCHRYDGWVGKESHSSINSFCDWADKRIKYEDFLRHKGDMEKRQRNRLYDLVRSLFYYLRTGDYEGFEDGEIVAALKAKGGLSAQLIGRLRAEAASIGRKDDKRLVKQVFTNRFMLELGFKFQR